jgi:ATP-dependent DNA ligase
MAAPQPCFSLENTSFGISGCSNCPLSVVGILYAFDLLELDGEDWRPRPLVERKAALASILEFSSRKRRDALRAAPPQSSGVRYTEHIEGDGATIFAHACKLSFEGIVSMHRAHPYRSGPTKSWIKVKNPSAPGVLRFEEGT